MCVGVGDLVVGVGVVCGGGRRWWLSSSLVVGGRRWLLVVAVGVKMVGGTGRSWWGDDAKRELLCKNQMCECNDDAVAPALG